MKAFYIPTCCANAHPEGAPFEHYGLLQSVEWDTTHLPVPADLLVYTRDEWEALTGRFRDTVEREAVWVYGV